MCIKLQPLHFFNAQFYFCIHICNKVVSLLHFSSIYASLLLARKTAYPFSQTKQVKMRTSFVVLGFLVTFAILPENLKAESVGGKGIISL